MHPYIKHLLIDIENAARQKEDIHDSSPLTFEEEMEEIERYVSGEYQKPLSYFTGLKKEDFPPAEQLSERDMKIVLNAFDQMLRTWNADIVYPDNMPVDARYTFLREHVLENEMTPVSSGFITFDFCTGYAPGCDWGEYCTCREAYENFDASDFLDDEPSDKEDDDYPF